VLLLALIAFAVPLGFSLRDRVDAEVRLQSRAQADVVAATAADLLSSSRRADLRGLVRTAARSARGRVIVVDATGRVIADSAGPAALGTSYAQRPEIAAALSGHSLQQTRRSQTLGEDLLATATPMVHLGRPTGAVRITQSLAAVHSAVRGSIGGLALVAGVVLLMGLLAGALIAGHLAGPLRRLQTTAGRIAGGDLDQRAVVEGTSEQRSLARSFNEMTERLSRALRSQREFVADASHQLRTPLTGLRLRVEEARAMAPRNGSPGAQEELDAALGEVDRLSHIVDELLVLSQTEGTGAEADEIELAEAASASAARWSAAADGRGIALSAHARAAGSVRCARPDLDRALDSLIENAINYAPQGTTVQVTALPHAIEVTDDGPGLAPEELEAVFERFHRGRAGRSGPRGTGLGLPIARDLMVRWGAVTTIENRPAGGARAAISFERSAAVR
jgi:signal transduction histidine kinase